VAAADDTLERDLDAAWEALERGEAGAAARALESARAAAPASPSVLELEAEIALAREDFPAALDAFARWAAASPSDPQPRLSAAEVQLYELNDPRGTRELLDGLLAIPGLDPVNEADAHHLLGLACEELRDREAMAAHWLRVRELDISTQPRRPRLSGDDFEAVAERALGELPDEVLDWLAAVPLLVDDRPTTDMVRDGIDPRLLGLFTGVPADRQSVLGGSAQPDVIYLFQRNLERETGSDEQLREQIRITVLHETAHFFGFDEDRLRDLGLG
jgi:predicted Zn-dependent protease with MMP-like domain